MCLGQESETSEMELMFNEVTNVVQRPHTHTPVKAKLETLVLVRGITVFTVSVVGVFIVGLLTRLAVLATWATETRGTNE